jgi:trimethylamine--corrinoid protein Co-methyltransferase
MSLASRDIYRYLGLEMGPMGGVGHLTTSDACKPGIHAGIEKAYTAALNLLLGAAPYISHGGMLGPGGLVGSIEQIVIDAEIVSMLDRLSQGFEVNDETLALDAIMEVGFDGTFMAHEHTAAHFRRELWLPRIIRRLNPSAWNEEKPDMLSAARAKVKEILASNDPRALERSQERELDRIVARIGMNAGPGERTADT